jgi:type IV secretory pathway TraG/TraD family ATPase VirD4
MPVMLLRAPLAGSATTLGLATLAAAVRGRRWHREDLEAGADLAEIASERHHPLDALRLASGLLGANLAAIWSARWSARRSSAARLPLAGARDGGLKRSERSHRWLRGDELTLGDDAHGRPVSIRLGGAGEGAHTLVVGATGSGKTVTQTWIATHAIARGMAVVVVDPKDDRALREAVRRAARSAGRRFIEWTPTGPSVYNPYARGGETEIADKALAGERYTEPHYQRQAQRYLGHAVRVLHGAGVEVSLAGLVRMLDPAQLELLARELPPESARVVHDYLDSLTARQHSDLTGVRDRLAIMAESDVGPWLDPVTPGAQRFDLLDALRARAVVCFSLRADSRPLLAQMLGGAIVQDLQTVVSALQGHPVPALVLIDEFSAVSAEHVARLFGRARSAGISLLLGTQELSDLRLPGHEQLLEQVLGNLTCLIAHRQVVPDSAELIARLAGTRGAWHTTRSSDGRVSRTRAREYLINPEEVRGLTRGRAAVIRLTERGRVAIAQVLPPTTPR